MKESKETVQDENKESKETQDSEEKSGTEEHDTHIISEEFQREVSSLIEQYKDSKPCLNYMRDRVSQAEDDLRKKEYEAEASKKKGKKVPDEYSLASAPSY